MRKRLAEGREEFQSSGERKKPAEKDDEDEENEEEESGAPITAELVTASAYEAQDYLDSSEDLVERILVELVLSVGLPRTWDLELVENAELHRQTLPLPHFAQGEVCWFGAEQSIPQ